MEIIKELAKEFISDNDIEGDTPKEFSNKALLTSDDLHNSTEKLMFFNLIKDYVNSEYEEHYKDCKEQDCHSAKQFRKTMYYLNNNIKDLNIENIDDVFTSQELSDNHDKLNHVLSEIEKLRVGQEMIYDDLVDEINELKDLFHLGKKTWGQVLKGKALEMFLKGVVNKVIIKNFVEIVESDVSKLIS